MSTLLVTNGLLLTPISEYQPGAVLIEDRRILAAGPADGLRVPAGTKVIDAYEGIILPGLIDVHIHGAHGYDGAGPDLARLVEALPRHGITSFLPTTYVTEPERLLENIRLMAAILDDPPTGAQALGIHMEGPWFSPEKAGMGNPDPDTSLIDTTGPCLRSIKMA